MKSKPNNRFDTLMQEISDIALEDKTQNFYLLLNSTSKSKTLQEYYSQISGEAQPIWANTQYATWLQVMPYLVETTPDSVFLQWASEQPNDWGMLIASPYSLDAVLSHLRSLTQIWLPTGQHVFFRFFDPDASSLLLNNLEKIDLVALMGPCSHWISNKQTFVNPASPEQQKEKPFPWWELNENTAIKIQRESTITLQKNALTWLKKNHADLFFCYPFNILKAKVERMATRFVTNEAGLQKHLIESLRKEVYR
ncbi:DUF4123 domain-containing protein [Motilimonas sp. 1_MG-2023]|uniref:DUF4123 domain-containing protein n=1 Tax=Motilimonas sp. 1_MG-2023 TaxID=3062672 RepID=UPI0026E1C5D9|nr:DUF4123 domain-containing protein [Motilimonas sp. 1_MG-2023]MDO6528202.1 DUF4123 domain-containing protein [Motilimonas sp. 1_MG-2023]